MPKPNLTYSAANPKRAGTAQEEAVLKERLQDEYNNEFLRSVAQQYQKYGTLSDKQWAAIMKGARTDSRTPGNLPQFAAPRTPDFDGSKLFELFIVAATKLKFPTMHVPLGDKLPGQRLKIYISEKSPRFAGNLLITDGGKENRIIYAAVNKQHHGYINMSGMVHLSSEQAEQLCTAIMLLADDPVAYSKIVGIAYKHCCFCGLELTNASSLYHGYGPICADNYNLPWGELPAKPAAVDDSVPEL